ncbi:DAR GTPase 2, mitochondrial isoform X1 [Nymphaea colorata]|nr:DAR GTPase 2, mitochondrial isoform X1 [Nymphaea colorata]
MPAAVFSRRVGNLVKDAGRRTETGWFTPHMEAASRAILDRIPLVDCVIEVRDARIPVSSAYPQIERASTVSKRLIVLNKMDLSDHQQTQEWVKYFEEQQLQCCPVNSHNKECIKKFLQLLRAQMRELKVGFPDSTSTIMLIGIPNIGKSALINSLHQIGRVSALEKGKLKHAIVSSLPGETKDISSFKIASHPNIYILDTPGILAPEIPDSETGSKLAITGAIKDHLIGEYELAQYLLAIFNTSDAYKVWDTKGTKLSNYQNEKNSEEQEPESRRKQFPSDHTQDFIVKDVRHMLVQQISSFNGDLASEDDMVGLIEAQLRALHEAFRVPVDSGKEGLNRVATKLLNLYRTGRLGHLTLESPPRDCCNRMNSIKLDD